MAGRRKAHSLGQHLFPEEGIRYLDENARAVARERIRPDRAAVAQVAQNLETLLNDGVGFPALDVRDETDAACVVLVGGVVETLPLWGTYAVHGFSPKGD